MLYNVTGSVATRMHEMNVPLLYSYKSNPRRQARFFMVKNN